MFRRLLYGALLALTAFCLPIRAQEGTGPQGESNSAASAVSSESAPSAEPAGEESSPQAAEAPGDAAAELASAETEALGDADSGEPAASEEAATDATALDPKNDPANVPHYRHELFSKLWKGAEQKIPPGKIIKRGERIMVEFSGEYTYVTPTPLEIDEEGNVHFPVVGIIVKLAGIRYADLEDKIVNAFRNIGDPALTAERLQAGTTRFSIDLVDIRGARITVYGDGITPGEHVFNSTSVGLLYVLNEISFPLNRASLRRITVIWLDGAKRTFDLYGYADEELDAVNLLDRCRIEIPAKGPVVTIMGAVKNPAKIELVPGENWADALKYADGFAAGADPEQIHLTRYPIGAQERTYFFASTRPILLEDGDIIRVRTATQDWRKPIVSISGPGVVRSERRDITDRAMTLGELISFAGLQPDANDTVRVTRTNRDRSININNLTRPDWGFPLEPMDEVFVSSVHELRGGTKYVILQGAVNNPDSYTLANDMRLLDLLRLDGSIYNPEKRDLLYTVWLVRTDSATTITRAQRIDLASLLANPADTKNNPLLQSRDQVIAVGKAQFESGQINVRLYGSVNSPSEYSVAHDMALDGLISQAGGLTARYPVTVTRLHPRPTTDATTATAAVDTFVVDEPDGFKGVILSHHDIFLIEPTEQYKPVAIVHITGEVVHSGPIMLPLENRTLATALDSAGVRATGDAQSLSLMRGDTRVVLVADPRESAYLLRDGDRIHVPPIPNTVTIGGAVRNPTTFAWESGMKLPDIVTLANGFLENADPKRTYTLLPDGTYLKLHRFWLIKRWWKDIPRGAVITVPAKPPEKEKPPRRGPRHP